MHHTKAGWLAVGSFALGLMLGRGSAILPGGFVASPGESAPVTTSAKAHPGVGERGLDDAVRTTMQLSAPAQRPATPPQAAVTAGPAATIAQADALRRQRQFDQAIRVYQEVAAAGEMTADSWADYADALASTTSSLRGAPAKAIAEALRLEPKHAKALWLKASLEHEERHYADAVQTWETLLALVPQGSTDANIIRANIAEATRLAGGQG